MEIESRNIWFQNLKANRFPTFDLHACVMAKQHNKSTSSDDVPPMIDFKFDELMRVLLGVQPKSYHKTPKQKSSKISKKSD